MSNRQIDLTPFEGMTEGPWISEEWDEGKILGPISERHNNSHPVVAVVGDGWWGDMMVECNANKRAMAAVPDLIAELKKMYEREDALVGAIKELCDSEDSTGCSGDLTVVSLDPMLKLYELTSE
jgi:hypothetical protein